MRPIAIGEKASDTGVVISNAIDAQRHPIADPVFVAECRNRLDFDGALVLAGFFRDDVIARLVAEYDDRDDEAFYADSTHNVYLTDPDPSRGPTHPFNRQVKSSKGLLSDAQIPPDSALREIYDSKSFRDFLCGVLGIAQIHPYADEVSSINVHFASQGRELGWHFDNSSFAVTMLLRAPKEGGRFEYVKDVRTADNAEMAFERVGQILDGAEEVKILDFAPGDLVMFRGRNSLHRVTPVAGPVTRLLTVFAYNTEPNVALSDSALATFYGRSGGNQFG